MGGRVVAAYLEFPDMTTGSTKRPQTSYGDYAYEQGITALTVLSRLHGKAVAPDDVRRRCRKGVFDVAEMLNCGRALGLRLRELVSDWSGLAQLSLPAVGVLRSGEFLFLGQMVDDRLVVADLTSRRPKYMSREELENIWDGRVITLAPRKTWKDLAPGIHRLPRLVDIGVVAGRLRTTAESLRPFALGLSFVRRM
jgi:ATP-binding cassette, subfamily B, bacterial HlyB/CyaB